MSAALQLGDVVELETEDHMGEQGQVWTEPADGVAVIATGREFIKVRETNVRLVERVLPEPRGPVDQTAKLVTARKAHECGCEHGHFAGGHECRGIKPKQQYVRTVLFPGDTNASKRPWVMRLCLPCARSYDVTDPARLAVKS